MKVFLEYVAQKVIPPAATEVFGDLATRFYEGCIILRILDHRNLTGDPNTQPKMEDESNDASGDALEGQNPANEPKSYTTILQPTPLSMWHDFLYATDPHDWFTDQLAINIEAEVLKFSIRNIDLRVPQNPYHSPHSQILTAQEKRPLPGTLTKEEAYGLFTHRPEVPRKHRRLHEDIMQHGSEYEQLMLVMDEKPPQPSGQFMRLSFIESLRKKQKQARLNQMMQQQQQKQQPQGQQQQIQSPLDSQTQQPPSQRNSLSSSQPFMMDGPSQQQAPTAQMSQQPILQSQNFNRPPQVYNNPLNTAMSPESNYDNTNPSSSMVSTPTATSPGTSGSRTPKTRGGKISRPRGKTSMTRGGGSVRGRGKAGSKASGSDNYMSAGSSGSLGGMQVDSPLYGARSQQGWDNSGGGTMGGKTVPGKTVPGRTVPGKTVPGKTVPGKTIPGKQVSGKTLPNGGRPL